MIALHSLLMYVPIFIVMLNAWNVLVCQELHIQLSSGEMKAYDVKNIRNLSHSPGQLQIQFKDDTKQSLQLKSIKRMSFVNSVTSVKEYNAGNTCTKGSIQLYPNPASNIIAIPFTLTQIDVIEIALFDYYGRELRRIPIGFKGKGEHLFEIDMSEYPSGIYNIGISGNNFSKHGLFIKY